MAVLVWALLSCAISGAAGISLSCANSGAAGIGIPIIPEPHEHLDYSNLEIVSDPESYEAYVYTPPADDSGPREFPLIVYLHAASQQGGSLSNTLNPAATGTPLYEVWSKRAPEELGRHFIVAGPHSMGAWDSGKVLNFLDFLLSRKAGLSIDKRRLYIMGWAEGGDMALEVARMTPRRFAAVAAASAHAPPEVKPYHGMPLWAFHGKNDVKVNYTGILNFVTELDRHEGGTAEDTRITLYKEAPTPYGLPEQTGHASGMAAFLTPYLYHWAMGYFVPEK